MNVCRFRVCSGPAVYMVLTASRANVSAVSPEHYAKQTWTSVSLIRALIWRLVKMVLTDISAHVYRGMTGYIVRCT